MSWKLISCRIVLIFRYQIFKDEKDLKIATKIVNMVKDRQTFRSLPEIPGFGIFTGEGGLAYELLRLEKIAKKYQRCFVRRKGMNMKKVLVINGSRNYVSKGYKIISKIQKGLDSNKFEMVLFDPNKLQLEFCRGCKNCFNTGKCPLDLKDSGKLLKDSMIEVRFYNFFITCICT